jgi:glycosyltransferase involved in cell wall biosynthesis
MSRQGKPGRLTVSMVVGTINHRDAISNLCVQQMEMFARHGRTHGIHTDVKLYTGYSDVVDSRIAIVQDPGNLALDEHFVRSDVVLFHFGIRYRQFDALHLAPSAARKVVCYYGIAPPALTPESHRGPQYESYRQAVNLHVADQILITSNFLRKELQRMGIDQERVWKVPLPPCFPRPASLEERHTSNGVPQLLYVGRFIRPKGVSDLLQAFCDYIQRDDRPMRLDLVGSLTFSDRAYVDQLLRFVADHGLGDRVRFHFDLPNESLPERYLCADSLVIPSYHEGFCVPVIEAMGSGCFVICSDAGSLPETSGGLGRTFKAGDVDSLARRLGEFRDAWQQGNCRTDSELLPCREWQRRAVEYADGYSLESCEQILARTVLEDLHPLDMQTRECLAHAHRETLLRLRETPIQPPQSHGAVLRLTDGPTAQAAEGQVPRVSLKQRVRERLRSAPLVGKMCRYAKWLAFLPWEIHKLNVSFNEVKGALVHPSRELREQQVVIEKMLSQSLPQIADDLRRLRERQAA